MRLRSTMALVGTAALGGTLLLATPTWGAPANGKTDVSQAIAASESAQTVRVDGSVSQGKEKITLDVQASNAGKGQGSIGINGAVAHVIRLGSRIYFSADKAFWTANGGAAAAALFVGKWVYTAVTTTDGNSLAQFMDLTTLTHQLFGGNLDTATFSVGKSSTINGVPVIAINGKDSTGASSGIVYVAKTGKPYVIELTSTGGTSGKGTLVFSGYNQSVNPVAPKGAINLDQLSKQAG
jgi:hypothetical protein